MKSWAVTWIQVILLTLLAWAALLVTGLGGTMGGASQTLAHKLAANAQHLQRHGSSSLTSRALRRNESAVTSVQQVAEDSRAIGFHPTDGALPTSVVTLLIDAQQVDEPPRSATELCLKRRNRAHPSRAPPIRA